MRILISGAGIAGLALAGFLKEQGVEPVLLEKAQDWSRVGYGIALWGNGIRILERLGLADKFYAMGERIDAWTIRDGQGKILKQADLHLENLPPLTAIHRADLHGVLLENVPQDWIRMGTTLNRVQPRTTEVQVHLSDGSVEEYDLVVGADGVRSHLRSLAFDHWHRDRMVLIGDAAHAMHPIVGMGASLALEDAYVLADELAQTGTERIEQAVQRYSQRRQDRVATFQRQAKLTRGFTFTQQPWINSLCNFGVKHTPFFERFFLQQARDLAEDLFQNL